VGQDERKNTNKERGNTAPIGEAGHRFIQQVVTSCEENEAKFITEKSRIWEGNGSRVIREHTIVLQRLSLPHRERGQR